MTIPVNPLYPESFDSDDNLYLVHDSLRLTLLEDYSPGDTVIQTTGDPAVFLQMPDSGIITLTEQCSDLEDRAISFHYGAFDVNTGQFSDLDLLEGFNDVEKPKRITNVTVNVMAEHHNNIKNTLIAIQNFVGVKGTEDLEPLGETLEGRINFLRRLVFQPKAWFSVDNTIGNVPLCVEFTDQSFRLGTDGNTGEIKLTWDFGDQSSLISVYSTISVSDIVPDGNVDVLVRDTDGGKVRKCYRTPGIYSVKLTVENDFGSDEVVFEDLINARTASPEEAIIRFVEQTSLQEATPGVPPNGPYDEVPTIRSPINTLIQIEISSGENPDTPGFSYSGEPLDGDGNPIDPVQSYEWFIGDDLEHQNTPETTASFSVGGIYDLKLRVDTQFGAYRITTYEDAIDIVENINLWMWIYQNETTVRSYEYGLISETFKLTPATSTLTINRDDSFLDNVENSEQQKREFIKNTGFAPRGSLASGIGGSTMLYWASGRSESDLPATETINVAEYDGFNGTYITRTPITRQWNWANLNNPAGFSYFVFGDVDSRTPNTSFTNTSITTLELSGITSSTVELTEENYLNGALDLAQNPAVYDANGDPTFGHFSVYRTTWKDQTGYLTRNDGVGPFFRIKSFYRTEGVVGDQFRNIRKLTDIQGPTKIEGDLTTLSNGIYFLNNSGSVSRYSDSSDSWSTGGPGVNSLIYRGLQDTSVTDFDSPSNTLLLASDNDKRAYLSFDYSSNAFIKFNEIDLTFNSLSSRPSGTQWLMGVQ